MATCCSMNAWKKCVHQCRQRRVKSLCGRHHQTKPGNRLLMSLFFKNNYYFISTVVNYLLVKCALFFCYLCLILTFVCLSCLWLHCILLCVLQEVVFRLLPALVMLAACYVRFVLLCQIPRTFQSYNDSYTFIRL